MKKQNVIMVAIILVIAIVGVLVVGAIQGWFDTADETVAVLRDIKGIVRLERDGVSFSAENETVLRPGDRIVCEAGATAAIYVGDEYKHGLDGSLILTVLDPSAESYEIKTEPAQAQTPVIADPVTPPASGDPETDTTDSADPENDTTEAEPPESDTTAETQDTAADTTEADPPETSTSVPETSVPETSEPEPSEQETSEPESSETTEATEDKPTCTISIRCDTILNNMDNLDPAKAPYVPSNGWILYAEMEFTEGETVFDVLTRACSQYGIQIEYSWTPMYDSYYIEGINNLYEFDCGSESGWMYKVNGWFPNYGCSAYTVNDGDSIVWTYTCSGLGADVGATW